jgi:hypothetical protein
LDGKQKVAAPVDHDIVMLSVCCGSSGVAITLGGRGKMTLSGPQDAFQKRTRSFALSDWHPRFYR